jgi:hypothetical protein
VAVRDEFVAARVPGGDQSRTVIVEDAVEDHAGGKRQCIEHLEAAPGADAVAVLAPCMVEHVRLRRHRADASSLAFAEREVLQVEAEVDGEPGAVGPAVVRP